MRPSLRQLARRPALRRPQAFAAEASSLQGRGVQTPHEAWRIMFRAQSVRRSLLVSLVVGTLLNAINQGSAIVLGEHVVLWKIALTYCVPFAVSSYGTYAGVLSAASDRGQA
ncbi:nitrate/nitrite transporter NrtS [Phenylobacterium sp. LjRoot225]|uniref:nitrate/nitrite transporter NrtS n=1 Tax=Phenylobacterium sp. LjRoot225 TaxID=3342285 RepID=UPI003ED109A8